MDPAWRTSFADTTARPLLLSSGLESVLSSRLDEGPGSSKDLLSSTLLESAATPLLMTTATAKPAHRLAHQGISGRAKLLSARSYTFEYQRAKIYPCISVSDKRASEPGA